MSYIDISDLNAAYTAERIEEITGNDEDRLNAAILSAENTINRYLRTRYTVPFTVLPNELKDLACDLAWYYLWRINEVVPESIKYRFNNAIQTLKELSNGITQLDLTQELSGDSIYAGTRTMKFNSEWENNYSWN